MFLKKQAALLLATLSLGVVTITSAQAVNCDPGFLYNSCFWCDKTFADIHDTNNIRYKLDIASVTNKATVAAGRTDIPGLTEKFYKGLSPAQKENANEAYRWYFFMNNDYKVLLNSIDKRFGLGRDIKSPYDTNARARNHAEEEILNEFYLDSRTISNKLVGKRLSLHVSNKGGVCGHCLAGIKGGSVAGTTSAYRGILLQFTRRLSDLTVCIKASDPETGKRIPVIGGLANPRWLLKIKNGEVIN